MKNYKKIILKVMRKYKYFSCILNTLPPLLFLFFFLEEISCTVSSKIIRAFEIICVKNSYLVQFYKINICRVRFFSLYTIYKKHDDDKN